ncbi:MAG: helix-turn-helix transcriptional regulator [Acidobacteria bacterium]|nr:helix-turn-helix transcriptional regulator [Acidobacteriota bacterium]
MARCRGGRDRPPSSPRHGGLGTGGAVVRGPRRAAANGITALPESGMSKARGAEEVAAVDEVFRALAHESRRQILMVIQFRGGEMTAGQIADRFACAWPTTTRHLKVLEESRLLVVEKRGRVRVYRLAKERLLSVTQGWLAWFAPGADL